MAIDGRDYFVAIDVFEYIGIVSTMKKYETNWK